VTPSKGQIHESWASNKENYKAKGYILYLTKAENFSNLESKLSIQVQETYRIPNRGPK
jgi:NurA-like 5'-3' nuclease